VNGFIIKTGGGRVFKLLTSSKLLITRVYWINRSDKRHCWNIRLLLPRDLQWGGW
jgi:hypothetical protein